MTNNKEALQSVPRTNPEAVRPEIVGFNKFKDKKLFNDNQTEVIINKTARTALFIAMEDKPDLKGDVVFRNFKGSPTKDYSLEILNHETDDFVLLLSDKKPDMGSEKVKFKIGSLAQKMNLRDEDITEDMIVTSAIMHEVKHYSHYIGKTGIWLQKEKKSTIERLTKELEGKPESEKELSLIKYMSSLPHQVEADNFAAEWMNNHMYLFDPEVNPNPGKWSVIDDEPVQDSNASQIYP